MFHLSETETQAPPGRMSEFAKVGWQHAKMRGMRSLDEVQNDYGRKFLRDWIVRECAGQNKIAAKALGVSDSLISEVLSQKRGFGMKLLRALSAQTGTSIEVILGSDAAFGDGSISPEKLARRQFLGLFSGKDRVEAEAYVTEKSEEAARLPSGWGAYEILNNYWSPGFQAWRALRRGKAVDIEASVEDMDEDEATPVFARKRVAK